MIAFWFVLACFGGMVVAGCLCQWLDSRTYDGPDYTGADQ